MTFKRNDRFHDFAASNTTYSSGTVVLSGGNNITVGTNAQTVTISAFNQSVQTQGIQSLSASDHEFTSGRAVLTGGGAVTVSANSGGGGTNRTVTISAPTQSVQTQSNIQSIAASDTTYQTGQVQFTGSNMVTVKSSANQRVVIDATQTVQTQSMVNAISASDATKSGTVRITGGPNIVVGTDASGVTISGSAQGGGFTQRMVYPFRGTNTSVAASSQATLQLQPFQVQGSNSATLFAIPASISGNTNSSGAWSISLGVYTASGSTLSLGSSASFVVSYGTNNDITSVNSNRIRTVTLNTWNLTPGDYMMGLWFQSTNNGTMTNMAVANVNINGAQPAGFMFQPGNLSASTNAMPASIHDTAWVKVGGGSPPKEYVWTLLGSV